MVYVTSGQSVAEVYLAYDMDGDNISVFELKVTYYLGTNSGHIHVLASGFCMSQ